MGASRRKAFEQAHAKLVGPGLTRGFLHLLGGGEEVAEAAEIVGIGFAGVAIEERVRAQEDGAVAIVEGVRDDPVMQRRRIDKDIHAAHQPEDGPHGEAEAVKERQRAQRDAAAQTLVDVIVSGIEYGVEPTAARSTD